MLVKGIIHLPILFQPFMVRQTIDGLKTETRRNRNLNALNTDPDYWRFSKFHYEGGKMYATFVPKKKSKKNAKDNFVLKCPYGKPGDILFVRENFIEHRHNPIDIYYEADYPNGFDTNRDSYIIKPSIHLPYEGSRLFLKNNFVGLQRIQSISEEEIIAEGIRIPITAGGAVAWKAEENAAMSFMPMQTKIGKRDPTSYELYFAHWAEKWCEINGRESWDRNEWVWVIRFTIHELKKTK